VSCDPYKSIHAHNLFFRWVSHQDCILFYSISSSCLLRSRERHWKAFAISWWGMLISLLFCVLSC